MTGSLKNENCRMANQLVVMRNSDLRRLIKRKTIPQKDVNAKNNKKMTIDINMALSPLL